MRTGLFEGAKNFIDLGQNTAKWNQNEINSNTINIEFMQILFIFWENLEHVIRQNSMVFIFVWLKCWKM